MAKGEHATEYLVALMGVVRLAINEPERGFVFPDEEVDLEKGFKNEEVANNVVWNKDRDGRYRKVNKEWNGLINNWGRFADGFNKRLAAAKSPWHIKPGYIRGTGGAPSKFFLTWFSPQLQMTEVPTGKVSTRNNIEYYPDEIEEGKGLKKFLFKTGVPRRSKTHITVVMLLIFTIVSATIIVTLSYMETQTLYGLVITTILLAAFLKFDQWFNRYSLETITAVPGWMQTGVYYDLMLEWRNENALRSGPRNRSKERLFFTRHSGECPQCKGVVRLMDGGKDFPRRVVGRCENAMNEHVYSFDPTTTTGKAIR